MITIVTAEPVELSQRIVAADGELSEGFVLETRASGRLIARAVAVDAEEESEWAPAVFQVAYMAEELEDGAIRATLSALTPAPHEPWQSEDDENEMTLTCLGVVLRIPKDRKYPDDATREAADHFAAILSGRTVPLVDKLLESI